MSAELSSRATPEAALHGAGVGWHPGGMSLMYLRMSLYHAYA